MLIRSMSPKVIVADEIGKKEDIEAINYAVCSGCKGIFTAHGRNFTDISLNPVIHNLIETHTIERLIFLDDKDKGKVKDLYVLNRKNGEYEKTVSK
jgi:stage III sporulation protein AA